MILKRVSGALPGHSIDLSQLFFSGVLLAVLLLVLLQPLTASAQAPGNWLPAEVLSGGEEVGSYPSVAADSSGTIHVIWSGRSDEDPSQQMALLYRRYRQNAWSPPVDVILSPGGRSAQFPRTIVDSAGRLHVIWSAPADGPFGPLYHAWASAEDAGSVQQWSSPTEIAVGTYQGDLAEDSRGVLHLVYADVLDDKGICHVRSDDHGDTWEAATCIARNYPLQEDEHEVRPRIAIDSGDGLHVVWVLDDYSPLSRLAYSGRAIYYATSLDGGSSWSDSDSIDSVDSRDDNKDVLQPEWPSIAVDDQDRVHIVWVGSPDMQRYHQYSQDGGTTWSQRQVAIPSGGYNGWMGLMADSDDVLHFVAPSLKGLEYSRWKDGFWSAPLLLPGTNGAHWAQATVALGNELQAVWQNHGGNPIRGQAAPVLYSSVDTGSARIAPMPVPTVAAAVVSQIPKDRSVDPQLVEATPASQPTPQFSRTAPPQNGSSDPLMPILISTLSAAGVIATALFVRAWRS